MIDTFLKMSLDKEIVSTRICIIEPFFGGSHKQLLNLIQSELDLLNLKYDTGFITNLSDILSPSKTILIIPHLNDLFLVQDTLTRYTNKIHYNHNCT